MQWRHHNMPVACAVAGASERALLEVNKWIRLSLSISTPQKQPEYQTGNKKKELMLLCFVTGAF